MKKKQEFEGEIGHQSLNSQRSVRVDSTILSYVFIYVF